MYRRYIEGISKMYRRNCLNGTRVLYQAYSFDDNTGGTLDYLRELGKKRSIMTGFSLF